MTTLVDDIIKLVTDGWRPYRGTVARSVYEDLQCKFLLQDKLNAKNGPYWFHKGDVFVCIACAKKCSLSRPQGFQVLLPLRYPATKQQYTLLPQEMVEKLRLLSVQQAAYCLNASASQIYHWIEEGKLRRLKEKPVRVAAEDVKSLMENWED